MNGDAGSPYFHVVFVMRTLSILGLVAALLGGVVDTRAQNADRPSLMVDLCGCMSAIDLRAEDHRVEAGVRNCLENAVVMHPSEVQAVLRNTPPTGSRAFQLGSALGSNLLRVCEPFRAVKARLQQMPAQKAGT
jgi:hypothetical protein